jgi:hypothetical protein
LASSLGRGTLSFLKCGSSAPQYSTFTLPQGASLVVEPPFMKHVFQIKAKKRDGTQRKISYLFSVANSAQQQNWSQQIEKVMHAIDRGRKVEYGISLNDTAGQQILSSFALSKDGTNIVPKDAAIEFR